MLDLSIVVTTPEATHSGVIVILKNGRRINKPGAAVKTTVVGTDYIRGAYIDLNAADIAILKTSPISKFQLYTDNDEIEAYDADFIYKTFLCLLDRK